MECELMKCYAYVDNDMCQCKKKACVKICGYALCWRHAKPHLPDIEILNSTGRKHIIQMLWEPNK